MARISRRPSACRSPSPSAAAPRDPIALADDDPDNFVHAGLDAATDAISVAVEAGHFHDPGDDANPDTKMEVVAGLGRARDR